jgi:hypothetical protein
MAGGVELGRKLEPLDLTASQASLLDGPDVRDLAVGQQLAQPLEVRPGDHRWRR